MCLQPHMLASCDSAKRLISIHFLVLSLFNKALVFLTHLTCPACSCHHQDKPRRYTEEHSGLVPHNKKGMPHRTASKLYKRISYACANHRIPCLFLSFFFLNPLSILKRGMNKLDCYSNHCLQVCVWWGVGGYVWCLLS